MARVLKDKWNNLESQRVSDGMIRYFLKGENVFWQVIVSEGGEDIPRHSHEVEQVTFVLEGKVKLIVGGSEHVLEEGDVILIPPNIPHWGVVIERSKYVDFFPASQVKIFKKIIGLRRQLLSRLPGISLRSRIQSR